MGTKEDPQPAEIPEESSQGNYDNGKLAEGSGKKVEKTAASSMEAPVQVASEMPEQRAVDQKKVDEPASVKESVQENIFGITSEWLASQVLSDSSAQVAGHPGTVRTLKGPSGEALVVKESLSSEVGFYNDIAAMENREGESNKQADKRRALSKDWTPKFYGSVPGSQEARSSIALEDLLAPYDKANVLDVKLGTQMWDEEDATEEKKERMDKAAKDTTSFEAGIRLTGWRTWDPAEAKYRTVGKAFGKHISQEQLYIGLESFFGLLRGKRLEAFGAIEAECQGKNDQDGNPLPEAVELEKRTSKKLPKTSRSPRLEAQMVTTMIEKYLLPQLNRLTALMSSLDVRIRGGSLLIVFEGNPELLLKNLKAPRQPQGEISRSLTIRLIDFAHARLVPGQGPDQGVLTGLRTFQRVLREEVLRSQTAVTLASLSEQDARRLPASRALRLEGLVRPLNAASLQQKCLDVANDGVEAEEQLDETFGEGGVWLDGIKSSGWVVFKRAAASQRVLEACHGKPFPTSDDNRPPVRFYPIHADIAPSFLQREEKEWETKKTKPQVLVRLPREGEGEECVFFLRSNYAEHRQQQQRQKHERYQDDRKRKDRNDPSFAGREGVQGGKYRRRDDHPQGRMQTTIRGVASSHSPSNGVGLVGRMSGYEAPASACREAYGSEVIAKPQASVAAGYVNDDPSRPPLPSAASVDLDPRPTLHLERERKRERERERGWERGPDRDYQRESEYRRLPRYDDRLGPPAEYAPRPYQERPPEQPRSGRWTDPRQLERSENVWSSSLARERGDWESSQAYSRVPDRRRVASPGWMDRPGSASSFVPSAGPPTASGPRERSDKRSRYQAAEPSPFDGRAWGDVSRSRGPPPPSLEQPYGRGGYYGGRSGQDDYYQARRPPAAGQRDRHRADARPLQPASAGYQRGRYDGAEASNDGHAERRGDDTGRQREAQWDR